MYLLRVTTSIKWCSRNLDPGFMIPVLALGL